jgi:MFS family permease
MKSIALKSIRYQSWINFFAGAVFLVPIITLFYKYTGLGLFEIIIVANVSSFCVWLFEIPTSVFADTMGRKRSLTYSMIANFFGALMILFFPSFAGFIIASVFSALYFSFWSGTGQAFLDENLQVLNKQKEFGKYIGSFMFYEQLAAFTTPIIASLILKSFGDTGYTMLAALDAFFALIMVLLVFRLRMINKPRVVKSVKHALKQNYQTAKDAFLNIMQNSKLKLLLIYRSFANHVAFFPIILLPVLSDNGMPEWISGILMAVATVGAMITMKFGHKIGEKYSYNLSWVVSTIIQAILLIIAALVIQSWIVTAIIYLIFNTFEGLWQPAWNHVLVEQTRGKAIATTRSIVFAIFALYTTLGKQLLAVFEVKYALLGLGLFIIFINLLLGRKMLKIKAT